MRIHSFQPAQNIKPRLFLRTPVLLLSLGVAVFVSGCKTIDSTGAANFASSVTAVKTQANDTLNAAASLTRDAGIAFVMTRPTLKESDFAETPSPEVIAEWDSALAGIESYALNLSALTSPDATKNFDVAATNLFNQFKETAGRLNAGSLQSSAGVSGLLATAFTDTAELILKAKAQSTAVKVAQTTDVKISDILNLLAREIGADRTTPGLRQTIYRTWKAKLDAMDAPFAATRDQQGKIDTASRQPIVQAYHDMLAQRDAQDQALQGLRRSLLALNDAHHSLAHGNTTSIKSALTIVVSEVQHARDLYKQFHPDTTK